MKEKLHFKELEKLLSFLNTDLVDQEKGEVTPFDLVYQMNVELHMKYSGRVCELYFLGTNHAKEKGNDKEAAKNEKDSIDKFLSNVPEISRILVEQGISRNSFTVNNILDEYIKPLLNNPKLKKTVSMERLYGVMAGEEIIYACEKAYGKDIVLKNMDLKLNPEAIPFLINDFGLEETIKELKSWIGRYFVDEKILNYTIREILSEQGFKINKRKIKKIPKNLDPKNFEFKLDYDRNLFMANTIYEELKTNDKVYAIAHTGHIIKIMKLFQKKEEITSLSATLNYTPEADDRIREEKKLLYGLWLIESSLQKL